MKIYYKLARTDGYDFHTGRTINYRANIGKTVKVPGQGKRELCTDTVLHAAGNPNDCFAGVSIPCSAYEVTGRPVVMGRDKCGFESLRVIREITDLDALFGWDYTEAANPVHPFQLPQVEQVTETHLDLLREWASVRASLEDLVRVLLEASVWNSVWNSVGALAWNSVWNSVGVSVEESVGALAWDSVWNSVWTSVGVSVWRSAADPAGRSVWDPIKAYVGSLFPGIERWKYVDHAPGVYPFQSAADLWRMGVVPSYDGETWRLHSGGKAEIAWEGEI